MKTGAKGAAVIALALLTASNAAAIVPAIDEEEPQHRIFEAYQNGDLELARAEYQAEIHGLVATVQDATATMEERTIRQRADVERRFDGETLAREKRILSSDDPIAEPILQDTLAQIGELYSRVKFWIQCELWFADGKMPPSVVEEWARVATVLEQALDEVRHGADSVTSWMYDWTPRSFENSYRWADELQTTVATFLAWQPGLTKSLGSGGRSLAERLAADPAFREQVDSYAKRGRAGVFATIPGSRREPPPRETGASTMPPKGAVPPPAPFANEQTHPEVFELLRTYYTALARGDGEVLALLLPGTSEQEVEAIAQRSMQEARRWGLQSEFVVELRDVRVTDEGDRGFVVEVGSFTLRGPSNAEMSGTDSLRVAKDGDRLIIVEI